MNQSDINNATMLRKGTVLRGIYRIDSYLSSGGFGNTYVATNIEFDEQVAIKEFFMKGVTERDGNQTTVSVSNSENKDSFFEQREKFKKEARRIRQLKNEHIVAVHDLFDENGTSYYVMDYVDGENLSERLKRTGRAMTESEVRLILPQILDALKAVHEAGIWHLDLKPANIMIDKEGKVKLIDFGASKQLNSQKGGATTGTAITYTNGYAPREQMEQNYDKFGPWTDIYALGATLYTLLTNKRPPLPTDIDDDISEDKHVALPFPESVSENMKSFVLKMLHTNRSLRPQRVDDLISAYSKVSFNKPKVLKDNRVGLGDKPNELEVTILYDSEKHEGPIIIKESEKPENPPKSAPQPTPPTPTWKPVVGLALVSLVLFIFLLLIPKMSRNGESAEPINQDAQSSEISAGLSLSPILQDLVNNMVRVDGGTFMMGATSEQYQSSGLSSGFYKDVMPNHLVTLSSFSIGKYEVTQEEWEAVMGSNPSGSFKERKHPVENVSWDDCQKFIRKLNELTGMSFRLPTEAEWEFAARGGTRSRGYMYAGSNFIGIVAWYIDNSGLITHEVGQKAPNELGLYDMNGNVGEWCSDWYGEYSSSVQTNPKGLSSGFLRVNRGGSYSGSDFGACHMLIRDKSMPSNRNYNTGLRLVL